MAKQGKKAKADSLTKPKSAWRGPTGGYFAGDKWMQDRTLRMICLHAESRPKECLLLQHAVVFRYLLEILGDHDVDLSILQLKHKVGNKLEEAGWKPSLHSHWRRRIRMSELAGESGLLELKRINEEQHEDIHFEAWRGGGATRHCVWTLSRYFGRPEGTEFKLLLKHVSRTSRSAFVELVHSFFAEAVSRESFRFGWAEEATRVVPGRWHTEMSGDQADAILRSYILQIAAKMSDPPYPVIAPILAISERHTLRVGGIDKLRRQLMQTWRGVPRSSEEDEADVATLIQSTGKGCLACVVRAEAFLFPFVDTAYLCPVLVETLAKMGILSWTLPAGLTATFMQESEAQQIDHEATDDGFGISESKFRHQASTTLPRCIHHGVHSTDNLPQSAHTASNRVWVRVKSRGGSEAVAVYAVKLRGDEGFVDPVSVGSLDRDDAGLYFDSRVHGHDAEHSENAGRALTPRTMKQFVCPACAGRLFHVWAGFEYHFDDPHFANAALAERCQDVFDWFDLVAACVSCKWHGEVVSVECA